MTQPTKPEEIKTPQEVAREFVKKIRCLDDLDRARLIELNEQVMQE